MHKIQSGDFVDFIDPSDIGVKTRQIELRDGKQWRCALVKSGCHRRVELDLAQFGLRSFYPRLRRWVSHARTKTAKEFPILGRYVFVEAAKEDFWAISSVHGIDGMVSDAEGPVEIPPSVVTQFRNRYLAGEWDMVRRDCPRPVFDVDRRGRYGIVDWKQNEPLPVGARIRVVVGNFEDMLATITSREGKKVTFKIRDSNTYGTENEKGVRAA